ncbi:hypothetical protein, partial [Klebsiella pneumoniae]|uniref:hypothetical protein n=1 Tax=Klebsiella pneumoniae TaxID=573 RepID=UPI002730D5AD
PQMREGHKAEEDDETSENSYRAIPHPIRFTYMSFSHADDRFYPFVRSAGSAENQPFHNPLTI